jgi:hypothetical protein
MNFKPLDPLETELVGTWHVEAKEARADLEEQRIAWLLDNSLKKVAQDQSGWQSLYRDPRDERFWELTLPHSEMHGGGPRRLAFVAESDARSRYNFSTDVD